MAKSRVPDPQARAKRKAAPQGASATGGGYFQWSRHPAVGLFAVLPLWLLYIALRTQLAPDERNGAEELLLGQLHRFGDRAHLFVHAGFALLILIAAGSLLRGKVPWLRVTAVIALEGLVYGVMLGPIASVMTASANRLLRAGADLRESAEAVAVKASDALLPDLGGSMGAGIFEELVFRLGLMSLLVYIGMHAVRAWSMPRWLAGLFAVIGSALVFSWFHHLCGEAFDQARFIFRTMAGVLLGLLMWARGYGVCVYTHTAYDIYFYLAR
ncbi:MAG: CPBP family glutamic-type intramembrane protease [Planctomycetota bacterium]